MSADETPASRPPTGKNPERAGSASPAPGSPQQSADRARAEEARRMRERVQQREMSEGREGSGGTGSSSAGQARGAQSAGTRGTNPQDRGAGPGRQRGAQSPRPEGSRKGGAQSGGAQSGGAQSGGRTIASASASVPRRTEKPSSKRPVITGVAAAKLLGKSQDKSGTSTEQKPPSDRSATAGTTGPGTAVSTDQDERGTGRVERPRKTSGGGIDGPTSHIDRSSVAAADMPDLGRVRHPATAETRTEHESHPRTAVTVGRRRGRGPLRAAMQLRSIDPWSALKVSLVLSVAMFLVWMVAVAIIYVVLDGMGVWDRLNTGVSDIISTEESSSALVGPGQVFGVAAILGIINIVLFTALSTLGAFIYNMSSDIVGGVEVTLADRD